MPYIPQKERAELDDEIDMLVQKLSKTPAEKMDGKLNYVITRLLVKLYPPSYFNYNRALGVLSAVAHEFYRRRVAPYEDVKIRENGDVY
ncbi:MAG: hypothetical protein NZ570_08150 [Candidatus Caldarchaeum sp.]|nr:hypothetical protein [Candidatus Caldarchaeum sp.]MDW7978775.1 hypothetical protein [Candidatus Caldarchaeum sp.]MDW8360022.1 hypothetical protein [Candidatus Caldarchaeum sp.]